MRLLLEYLYVGTAAFERDVAYYRDVLGAAIVWAFHAFGVKVAALRPCDGPLILSADHRRRQEENEGEMSPTWETS